MTGISPKKIDGLWDEGFALDYHTSGCDFVGFDENNQESFASTRTAMGELYYRLRSKNDLTVIDEIAKTAAEFVRSKNWSIDMVIPVPPSSPRIMQPVVVLAERLAKELKIVCCKECAVRVKNAPQPNNGVGPGGSGNILSGAFQVDRAKIRGRRILLFDDLYRSGATLNGLYSTIQKSGLTSGIYALALTMTRIKR